MMTHIKYSKSIFCHNLSSLNVGGLVLGQIIYRKIKNLGDSNENRIFDSL
jgi:hypothetical protein